MKIPMIKGLIKRRILVNFAVDPKVLSKQLPEHFKPVIRNGWGIGGVCLIRLEQIRPCGLPSFLGIKSENAAFRFHVTWNETENLKKTGVYIPRRDTNSVLNHLAGSRVFPGIHYLSDFKCEEDLNNFDIEYSSTKSNFSTKITASVDHKFSETALFKNFLEASDFFKEASLGYSPLSKPNFYEGLSLLTQHWHMKPLKVQSFKSSFFLDRENFSKESIRFDCALLMQNIPHFWRKENLIHAV